MRYMLMHKLDENVPGTYDPSPEFQARMGKFVKEAYQAGVVLATEGLHSTKVDSARITVSEGKTTIKDGPFTETKELIAGFALVEVRSKEEAVEWARRFTEVFIESGLDVEVDIRPICEMPGQ